MALLIQASGRGRSAPAMPADVCPSDACVLTTKVANLGDAAPTWCVNSIPYVLYWLFIMGMLRLRCNFVMMPSISLSADQHRCAVNMYVQEIFTTRLVVQFVVCTLSVCQPVPQLYEVQTRTSPRILHRSAQRIHPSETWSRVFLFLIVTAVVSSSVSKCSRTCSQPRKHTYVEIQEHFAIHMMH